MPLSKYINNISALQFFQIFRFGVLLLISILFTKTHLAVREIGIYETILFLAGAVSFFWLSGLIQSLLPLYKNNKQTDKKNPAVFNAFLLISFFSLLASGIIYFARTPITSSIGNADIIPYIDLLCLYVLLSGPANLAEYIYLLTGQAKKLIYYGIISMTLQLLFVALPVVLGYPIIWGITGLVIISGLRVLWLLRLIFIHSGFSLNIPFIKEHLSLGYPLILSALLSGSAQYINDYIVSVYYDSETFAVFKYGAKQFPLIVLLASSFSNAMVPEFSGRPIPEVLSEIKRKSLKLMHLLFPATMVLLLTSHWLYPFVFNKMFQESASIFNILLLLVISYMVFPQTVLIGLKKTKQILFISLLEISLLISLSLILINFMGVRGVAAATVIAYCLERIFLILIIYKFIKIPPSAYIPLKKYLVYVVLLSAAFTASCFIHASVCS